LDAIAREQGVDRDDIELWCGDEARIGQKNKITRRWAKRGTRPSAPHDQRTASTYIVGAICPQEGTGAARVLPWCHTDGMALHLAEISKKVGSGRHATPRCRSPRPAGAPPQSSPSLATSPSSHCRPNAQS
jgi:hypothetical protein